MSSSKKLRRGQTGEFNGEKFRVGSGNVFRDLALPNSRLRLLKAELAATINGILDAYDWTQGEVAKRLGTQQPTVSLLRKGQLSGISSERLLSWLGALDHDVVIKVSRAKSAKPKIEVLAPAYAAR